MSFKEQDLVIIKKGKGIPGLFFSDDEVFVVLEPVDKDGNIIVRPQSDAARITAAEDIFEIANN